MRNTERFKDIPWYKEEDREKVMIGGCGGIGSFLTFFLYRAGFEVVVVDDDRIEKHNLGGQLFKQTDIGRYKAVALNSLCASYGGENINTMVARIDENTTMNHCFMFSAFDNMEARKNMFRVWKSGIANYPIQPILIDGRLEAEYMQIICVTPETMDYYEEKYLFDDNRVEDLPCTLKQTTHAAAMIASYMTAFFTNHITNIYERTVLREVPFFKEILLPMNFSETILKPVEDEQIIE